MSARVSGGAPVRATNGKTAPSVNTLFRPRERVATAQRRLTPAQTPVSRMVKEMRGLQTFIADIREGSPHTPHNSTRDSLRRSKVHRGRGQAHQQGAGQDSPEVW